MAATTILEQKPKQAAKESAKPLFLPRQIEQCSEVSRWLVDFFQSPRGVRKRREVLTRYCNFTRKDPTALVSVGKTNAEQLDSTILPFFKHMLEVDHLAEPSAKTYLAIVRSFFKKNKVVLDKFPVLIRQVPISQWETKRLCTIEDARAMISHTKKPRNKALIGVVFCSGQRQGIIRALKPTLVTLHGDNATVEVPSILAANGLANVNKTKIHYFYGLPADAVSLLRQLEVSQDEYYFPITDNEFTENVERAGARAGIQRLIKQNNGQMKREVHPHMIRGSWKYHMKKAGITDESLLEYMLGHKLKFGGTYDRGVDSLIAETMQKVQPYFKLL